VVLYHPQQGINFYKPRLFREKTGEEAAPQTTTLQWDRLSCYILFDDGFYSSTDSSFCDKDFLHWRNRLHCIVFIHCWHW